MGPGIGIICKTPRAGHSKTRLHGVLTPDEAAELSGCFLADVSATITTLGASHGAAGYAVYAPEGSEAELRRYIPETFDLVCRRDATLGVVLLGATQALLAHGHHSAILVNSDSPTLPARLYAEAIETLGRPGDRVVLGPATDGGYYLIGLKQAHAHLFSDIPWSTSAVMRRTLERAAEIGLAAHTLPAWYDVDEPETLGVLIDEIEQEIVPLDCGGKAGNAAPATRAFIEARPHLLARVTAARARTRSA
jgi:uncharacterized protein